MTFEGGRPVESEAPLPADDPVAVALRGFGPLGLLAILAILAGNLIVAPLSAVLVLLWARRSRTPWREIGYVRPESWARGLIIGIAFGIAFKIAHYADQGLPGVQQATIFGLVFGTIFAITGRLWTLMCAHAAFDLTALAIIYWDLESDVARLIFK